jgi:hypothetical protein
VHRQLSLVTTIAICFFACPALVAQSAAHAPSPVGIWRGTSLCTVRPSACNDEIVVYRITRRATADSLTIDARKIVNGREEEMGTLGCAYMTADSQLRCTIPNGEWQFRLRSDSLLGELRLPDGRKFRDVRTAREHS